MPLNNRNRVKIKNNIGIIIFLTVMICLLLVLIRYSVCIDSDVIGDLLIAKETSGINRIFPNTVYYSTTLPSQYFGNIGIASILSKFISDIRAIFVISRCTEISISLFLLNYFLRYIIKGKNKRFFVLSLSVFPTVWFLYLNWLNGMYLWVTNITLLTFILIIKIFYSSSRAKRYSILIILSLLSFFVGIGGIKFSDVAICTPDSGNFGCNLF